MARIKTVGWTGLKFLFKKLASNCFVTENSSQNYMEHRNNNIIESNWNENGSTNLEFIHSSRADKHSDGFVVLNNNLIVT